jgi:hypothetical protein
MGQIILFALLSALYPTLIAATSVMLLLPRAKSLMLGFWLGAMITSVTCGLVIVFALHGSSVVSTSRHTVSPAIDLAIAVLLMVAALALARGEDQRVRARRRAHQSNREAKPPKWRRELQKGSPRHTLVIGILLSFPGVWYLAALDRLSRLHYAKATTIFVVVAFCIAQLALIEVPMLAFRIWPRETPITIDHVKAWGAAHGRRYAVWGLAAVGGLLVIRAGIGALA